jgi:hypothetical protein
MNPAFPSELFAAPLPSPGYRTDLFLFLSHVLDSPPTTPPSSHALATQDGLHDFQEAAQASIRVFWEIEWV